MTLSGALVESDRAHRRRSTIDPLTGLFNRNALEQRLAELDGSRDAGIEVPHALLLCDLDHFKRVNDQLGHAAGDTVLQEVAYTMRASAARRRLDLPDRRRGDPRRPAGRDRGSTP